jgi:hypothetical protein
MKIEESDLRLKESDNVRNLRSGKRKRRHALVGATGSNYGSDQVAIFIATNHRRADQIRTFAAGSVFSVAGCAAALECCLAAIGRCALRRSCMK